MQGDRMARKINWEKRADALVKSISLSLGYCERCGRSDHQLHHHHIFTRNNKAYRHDLNNIVCLCAGCHMLRADSVHKDLTTFYKWLRTTDRWKWFTKHTVRSVEMIANQKVVRYKPIKMEHEGDEQEYYKLKEMK